MSTTLVIGGGPAGLTAAHILVKNNKEVTVLEKDSVVGGLSKTINHKGFRFDLGGHRFWTKNKEVDKFVKDLMGDELITVPRTSRIFFNKKLFDYPLKPINALFGMGIFKSFQIVGDYLAIKLKNVFKSRPDISFEDWITNRFGKTMYELYFKPYTEKVWGIPCTELSADWAAQRIKGMSLRAAVKDALFPSKNAPKTLVKEFTFPKLGIGRLSEKLAENIENISFDSKVINLKHKGDKIISVEYTKDGKKESISADNVLSSMPLTSLIYALNPKPPEDIIEHANSLKYVNEIFILIVVDKDSITNDSWLYFPDNDISFVRVHEPKNWSKDMAPPGKTSVVVEYICKEDSTTWRSKDEELIQKVIKDMKKLGFIREDEFIEGCVVRSKKTYPVYDVGYLNHLTPIKEYIKRFKNLQIIGRNGTFKYNNLDHSIEAGLKAVKNLMGEHHDLDKVGQEQEYFEQNT